MHNGFPIKLWFDTLNNIVQKIEACLYGYTSPSKTVTLTMIYMYNKRSSAPNITRDILSYSTRSDHDTVKSENLHQPK